MREPLLEELEIVAFDGTLRGFCAPVLPVVRWKGQDLYAKISAEEPLSAPKAWHSAEEFQALCDQGLVTRLPGPIGEMFEGAMLAYLSRELLSSTSIAETQCDARCRWDFPGPEHSDYVVLGAPVRKISLFLDSIADDLRRSAERSLPYSPSRRDMSLAAIQHLLDMAFAAAQSPPIRKRLYLLVAILRIQTSDSDTLDTIHKLLVEKEFPTWRWEDFSREVLRYEQISQQKREKLDPVILSRIPAIELGQLPMFVPRVETVLFQGMLRSGSRARITDAQRMGENVARGVCHSETEAMQYMQAARLIVGRSDV